MRLLLAPCAASLYVLVMTIAVAEPVNKEVLANCRAVSNVAKMIMEKRQQGALMPDLMEAFGAMPVGSSLAQTMVRMAYERPRHSSSEYQSHSTANFQNEIYMLCLDNFEAKEKGQ